MLSCGWNSLVKTKVFCRECGESCGIFTHRNISKLNKVDQQDFYRELSDLYNGNVIISGDKNPLWYSTRTGDTDAFILLLKYPVAHVFSFFRREIKKTKSRDDALKKATGLYSKSLFQRIDWLVKKKNEGKDVFVISLEEFLQFNNEEKILLGNKHFEIEGYDDSNILRDSHYIAGNHKVSVGGNAKGYFKSTFKTDDRYIDVFTKEEISTIKKRLRLSQAMYEKIGNFIYCSEVPWLDDFLMADKSL